MSRHSNPTRGRANARPPLTPLARTPAPSTAVLAVAVSVLAFLHGPPTALASAGHPTSVDALYRYLDTIGSPRLGVLSQGNFDSVHHLVPPRTVAAIYAHDSDLIAATLNGSVDAGLMSGVPTPSTGLATFSSTLVSPRGMFSCKQAECDTVVEALDAAVVRALNDGADVTAARANPPFEYIAVHTCRTNVVDRFPFPTPRPGDRLANASIAGRLRIAALGPYNWSNSGDYRANPPTGFWPQFLTAVEAHFVAGMGFGFERVYELTSAATMQLILDNAADATEPYWTVDAFFNDRARQHTFAVGCTTLGYDSTFFVKTNTSTSQRQTVLEDDDDNNGMQPGTIAAIVVAAVVAVGLLIALAKLQRERTEKARLYAKIEADHTFYNPVAKLSFPASGTVAAVNPSQPTLSGAVASGPTASQV